MRLKLKDAKIYTNEFDLAQTACCSQNEITIEEGYMDVDTTLILQECAKENREKVWEMARKVYGPVERGGLCGTELKECFGSIYPGGMFAMDVDEALEKYESWKKKNDVEAVIKSLKPQDVIAVPKIYERDSYLVYMVTMTNLYYEGECIIRGIDHTGDVILNRRNLEDYKGLKKIGRVEEVKDILGEIAKIEYEWRKNN